MQAACCDATGLQCYTCLQRTSRITPFLRSPTLSSQRYHSQRDTAIHHIAFASAVATGNFICFLLEAVAVYRAIIFVMVPSSNAGGDGDDNGDDDTEASRQQLSR